MFSIKVPKKVPPPKKNTFRKSDSLKYYGCYLKYRCCCWLAASAVAAAGAEEAVLMVLKLVLSMVASSCCCAVWWPVAKLITFVSFTGVHACTRRT